MTSRTVTSEIGKGSARAFSKALLKDLQALEKMLENGLIESGVRRFGCEQEMFLVNRAWRPAPVAMEVLERLDGEMPLDRTGLVSVQADKASVEWRRRFAELVRG